MAERKCGTSILGKKLGSGASGEVYAVKNTSEDEEEVVIKVLITEKGGKMTTFDSLIELDVLFRVKSPSLVGGKRIYEPRDCKGLTAPAIEMESLHNFRDLLYSKILSPKIKISFLYRMAMGVKCMHDNKILHLDLKPANMLYAGSLDSPFVKVADYGLSYQVDNINFGFYTNKLIGTKAYMTPEMHNVARTSSNEHEWLRNSPGYKKIKDKLKFNYTNKTDVWALGITAIYILQVGPNSDPDVSKWGKLHYNQAADKIIHTFTGDRREAYIDSVVKPLKLTSALSILIKDLLMGMLDANPVKRMDINAVVNHTLFTETKLVEILPSKKLHGTPIKSEPRAVTSMHLDENKCESINRPIWEIEPLKEAMLRGLKLIIAMYRGALRNYYVRDLFMSLDIYMRIIVASYSVSWTLCRKLAILATRMTYKYYYREVATVISEHDGEDLDQLEIRALKLLEGKIRMENLYDAAEYAEELKVCFDLLVAEEYSSFNSYFVISYAKLLAMVNADYVLATSNKIMDCATFLALKVNKKSSIQRRSK